MNASKQEKTFFVRVKVYAGCIKNKNRKSKHKVLFLFHQQLLFFFHVGASQSSSSRPERPVQGLRIECVAIVQSDAIPHAIVSLKYREKNRQLKETECIHHIAFPFYRVVSLQ